MFDYRTDQPSPAARAEHVASLDAAQTLSRVARQRGQREILESDELICAAHWADLHAFIDSASSPALPGAQRLVALGGEGTPDVAEFAPAELGAVLGVSPYAAAMVIGDALDLRHRLPVLWGRILSGDVKPFVGRRVAQATRVLSQQAAATVDRKVSRWADRLTGGRLAGVVEAAVIEADPEAAQVAAEAVRSDHGVWVSQSSDRGTKTAFIRADASDVIWFDASLDRIADGLAILGDGSSKQVRRARAVGVLAHPQQTLDLYDHVAVSIAGRDSTDLPDDVTADDGLLTFDHYTAPDECAPAGETAGVLSNDDVSPRPSASYGRRKVDSRPRATLFVHISQEAIQSPATRDQGVARVEGVGPVTTEQVRGWLGHCRVTVKPVIDLAGIAPVDSYEIPDRLREGVHLVSPADCFPFGSSTRRTGDIDHSTPFVPTDHGGPPGQTGIGNLGPLPRFHHRIRTHGNWQLKQPFPGIFVWRTPQGGLYLVDHTGTRRLRASA